jgi:hypothetical protein
MAQESPFELLDRNKRLYRLRQNETSLQAGDNLSYSSLSPLGPQAQLGNGAVLPAIAVAPGTQIFSAIWSTSNSGNRIMLTPDDNFTAFYNGRPHINIQRAGILVLEPDGTVQLNIKYDGFYFPQSDISTWDSGVSVITYTDTPATTVYRAEGGYLTETDAGIVITRGMHLPDGFTSDGVYQGIYYRGAVRGSDGLKIFGTGGILTSRTGVGTYRLQFVTPPTSVNVSCVVTASSGHFRGKCVYDPFTSTMTVTFQQSDYGSQSFSVSGGGGGSVTVSGIYQGESLVDTDFFFVITRSTN